MKFYFFMLFTSFSLLAFSQNNFDVQFYRYNIELNDANDTIYGKAEILVKFTEAANAVQFDLASLNKDGKGMIPLYVEGKSASKMTKSEGKIMIQLLHMVKAHDTASFTIVYKGIPADGLIISKNKYGDRTFFSDNWPNRAHNWIPCVDDPSDKAPVEFIITAPQKYQVISNGVKVEETNLAGNKKRTHWREDVPLPTKVMVIGAAEFAVQLAGTIDGCLPVYSWVYPQDRDNGFYDYAQATEVLPYFIRNVGPYPYAKLANVQAKTRFGGMENANAIFYPENSVTGARKDEATVVHEIAHQWFGNMATEKGFSHLWLSEGFATYMTILYMGNKYGSDTALHMLREDREQVIKFSKHNNAPVVDTNPDYMELLNANSYQKGGWALHMLKKQMGDSSFWKVIRKYYARYAGGNASTGDFQKVVEEVAGKKMEGFFTQWLYTTGQPHLIISWKYDPKAKRVTGMVSQEKTSFKLPIEIGVRNAAGNITISKVDVAGPSTPFSIQVKEKPIELIPDPNVSLLFSGTVVEQLLNGG
ncbi:MAG TPA: M1 family aminopeptidase [Chitinophagaceae bacterium]|nr:M1 family aminopeptidase [Chitinophagaceae bacterium]